MKWVSIESGIPSGRVVSATEPKHDRKVRWPVAADLSGQVAVEAVKASAGESVTAVMRHLMF